MFTYISWQKGFCMFCICCTYIALARLFLEINISKADFLSFNFTLKLASDVIFKLTNKAFIFQRVRSFQRMLLKLYFVFDEDSVPNDAEVQFYENIL